RPTTGPGTTAPFVRNGSGTRPTKIAMYFKDADVNAILEHLAAAAGFQVLPKPGLTIAGRITIDAQDPVTPEEAVTLLNVQLHGLGYAAVRRGAATRIARP